MREPTLWTSRAIFVALTVLFVTNPAYADRKNDRDDRSEHRDDRGHRGQSRHFDDHRRVVVREYYVKEYRGRHCPPGFVRKDHDCRPPGQARHWERGRPLPREVVYHTVPPQLVVELGTPPVGHQYVRVASDILLIAVGTGMVVDAINDLGR